MKSLSERNATGIKMLKREFLLKLMFIILSVVIKSLSIRHTFEFIHRESILPEESLGVPDQSWQKACDISSPRSLILSWLQAKAMASSTKLSFVTDFQEAVNKKMVSMGVLVLSSPFSNLLAPYPAACAKQK